MVCWNRSDRDFGEEHQCGSPLSPSVVFFEELQCAQTLSKVFFSVSKGNESDEGLLRTGTSEFHEEELVADKFRAAADEFQGEEFLMCDLGEFVLVESFREN